MSTQALWLTTLSAVLATAYAVIALFFLRFWRRTRDRLFAYFASAFLVLTVQRLVLGIGRAWSEDALWLYGLRLTAFVLIIVAIVEKNRAVDAR